jgi:hypothetical protein
MKKTKDRIVSIIALLVTVLYPCLFMYFQNVDEGNFKEILPAVGKFLLVIFDIKKKPLCEERLLFYVSVSH